MRAHLRSERAHHLRQSRHPLPPAGHTGDGLLLAPRRAGRALAPERVGAAVAKGVVLKPDENGRRVRQ